VRAEPAVRPAAGLRPTALAVALRRHHAAELARRFGIWCALAGFLAYCLIAVNNFATAATASNVLAAAPILGVAALGQTFVIAAGGLDLSVGQLASLTGVLCAILAPANAQLAWAVPLCLGLGLAAGLVNGSAIVFARANPVIVTFGMLSICEGGTYLLSLTSTGTAPSALAWVENQQVFGVIPVAALLLAALTVASWFAFSRSSFGLHLQAVGGSAANARKSGIAVARVTLAVYAISGLSGALAGLLLESRLKTGYPGAGTGLELSAIVAVIVGGTPFGGGRGTIPGTIAGVLLLSVLTAALNLLAIGTEVQLIVNGAVVAVAVALYSARRFRRWL
jgi:ribose transport system permease protein